MYVTKPWQLLLHLVTIALYTQVTHATAVNNSTIGESLQEWKDNKKLLSILKYTSLCGANVNNMIVGMGK